ncbi:serine/threonine protein kinase [bacterium]|nr:serine/threonine protein kinase [bacterium]
MSNLIIGDTVGERYKIIRILGEGAQSCVYLAEDLKLPGAVWALKQLRKQEHDGIDAEQNLHMFKREAEILKKLRHPAFPAFIDYLDDEEPVLVMERIKGMSLYGILKRSSAPLPLPSALAAALQISAALQLLHEQTPPIIYRDLKPSNLILSTGGLIRLIDFGIARFRRNTDAKDTQELGTPGYSAPEQYRGNSSVQSDLYALGVIIFQMLTLKDPQDCSFVFPRLSELDGSLPADLSDLVESCLDLDPAKRPDSAQTLKEELTAILASVPQGKANTQVLNSGLAALAQQAKYWQKNYRPSKIKKFWNGLKTAGRKLVGANRPKPAETDGTKPKTE